MCGGSAVAGLVQQHAVRVSLVFLRVSVVTVRFARCATLFPYTTLFRSLGRRAPRQRATVRVARALLPSLPAGTAGGLALLDRKSTRLNSSHPSISYAVFCLKQKIPT